jgi:hypothetical protein
MSQFQLALWIAHPVLQLIVAAVMYRRKLHRTFPVFFTYVVTQILIFSIVFPVYRSGNYARFFYTYWICAAISLALGFKVIHEIFLDIFRPYHTLKDLGSVLFKWAGLVMLLVAVVVAAASPSGDQDPLVQSVLTVQRCVRVIQCGLVLFLMVFSKYLGVSRRQHSFGIALGFGGFASIELLMVALHASGHVNPSAISWANMVGYNAAILVWMGYVLFKSPARDASATLLMSQRWDQSLNDIQNPVAGDSLIPMFEGMVDRALSRTNGDIRPALTASEPVAPRRTPSSAGLAKPPLSERHLASKT